MSRFSDTSRAGLALLCCFGAVCFSAQVAHAEEAGPSPGRSGFTFDLSLAGGGAQAEFTERETQVASFDALGVGGDMRFGWFAGSHVLLGCQLGGSWNTAVSSIRVQDESYFNAKPLPTEAAYTVFAPLGTFISVYPWQNEGLFFGLSAAIGVLELPAFAYGDSGFMSGYSIETGYDLGRSMKDGPTVFLRYSRWAAEEDPISSEHPDGLISRELWLGARWSFSAAQWR